MLSDQYRFGASQIDQTSEAVLRVLRRHALHGVAPANTMVTYGHFGRFIKTFSDGSETCPRERGRSKFSVGTGVILQMTAAPVSRGDAAEVFPATEHPFDGVAVAKEKGREAVLPLVIGF